MPCADAVVAINDTIAAMEKNFMLRELAVKKGEHLVRFIALVAGISDSGPMKRLNVMVAKLGPNGQTQSFYIWCFGGS